MTLDEFTSGIEKLRAVFGGERIYPIDRVKFFFDELRHVDPKHWDSAIVRLVKEETRPPMMKEIRSALAAEKSASWDREKRQEKREVEQIECKNLFTHEGFANHPVFGKVLPIKKREAGE